MSRKRKWSNRRISEGKVWGTVDTFRREMQMRKPAYQVMYAVTNWYKKNPVTPRATALKIADLHARGDQAMATLQTSHETELNVLMKQMDELRAQVTELGKKHAQEREDATMPYAQAELDLLKGTITEIPDALPPMSSKPGKLWRFFDSLLAYLPGYQQE